MKSYVVLIIVMVIAIQLTLSLSPPVSASTESPDTTEDVSKLRDTISHLSSVNQLNEKTVIDLRLQLQQKESYSDELVLTMKDITDNLLTLNSQIKELTSIKTTNEQVIHDLRGKLDAALLSSSEATKLAQHLKDTNAAFSLVKNNLHTCETSNKNLSTELEDSKSKSVVLKDALRVSEEGRNNAEALKHKFVECENVLKQQTSSYNTMKTDFSNLKIEATNLKIEHDQCVLKSSELSDTVKDMTMLNDKLKSCESELSHPIIKTTIIVKYYIIYIINMTYYATTATYTYIVAQSSMLVKHVKIFISYIQDNWKPWMSKLEDMTIKYMNVIPSYYNNIVHPYVQKGHTYLHSSQHTLNQFFDKHLESISIAAINGYKSDIALYLSYFITSIPMLFIIYLFYYFLIIMLRMNAARLNYICVSNNFILAGVAIFLYIYSQVIQSNQGQDDIMKQIFNTLMTRDSAMSIAMFVYGHMTIVAHFAAFYANSSFAVMTLYAAVMMGHLLVIWMIISQIYIPLIDSTYSPLPIHSLTSSISYLQLVLFYLLSALTCSIISKLSKESIMVTPSSFARVISESKQCLLCIITGYLSMLYIYHSIINVNSDPLSLCWSWDSNFAMISSAMMLALLVIVVVEWICTFTLHSLFQSVILLYATTHYLFVFYNYNMKQGSGSNSVSFTSQEYYWFCAAAVSCVILANLLASFTPFTFRRNKK